MGKRKTKKKPERPFLSREERRERIEMRMKILGYTWYRLSVEMNHTQGTVQRAFKYETPGRKDPSLGLLRACARALGLTVGFLVDREV